MNRLKVGERSEERRGKRQNVELGRDELRKMLAVDAGTTYHLSIIFVQRVVEEIPQRLHSLPSNPD